VSADGAAHAGGGGSPEVGAGGAAAVPLIVHFALATHGNPVQGLARALAADRKAWPRGAAVLGIKLTQHLAATEAQAAGGGEDGLAVRGATADGACPPACLLRHRSTSRCPFGVLSSVQVWGCLLVSLSSLRHCSRWRRTRPPADQGTKKVEPSRAEANPRATAAAWVAATICGLPTSLCSTARRTSGPRTVSAHFACAPRVRSLLASSGHPRDLVCAGGGVCL
jgi:hypothetical protein